MPTPEEALDAYLRRVQIAAQSRDAHAALRPEALEAIASELGLTQADLQAAREAGADHVARGEAFFRHGRHQDAAREWAAAAALNPGEASLWVKLAEAHLGLYQSSGATEELQAAQAWVRRAIALDPHLSEAYGLLNRLDPPTAPAFPASARRTSLIVAVLGLAVLGAVLAFAFRGQPFAPSPAEAPTPQAQSTEAEAVAQPPGPDEALVPWAGGPTQGGTRNLPGRLTKAPTGLSLALPKSELLVTAEGKAYLTLAVLLAWQGPGELDGLVADLLVRNARGQLRQREKLDLLPDYQPAHRPGEAVRFVTTVATAPDATQLEFRVKQATVRPLVGRPPEGEAFPLAWEVDVPGGVQLVVHRRKAGMPAPGGFMRFAKPTFVVRNQGAAPLRQMVLELRLTDAEGRVVATRRGHLLPGAGHSLDPGQATPIGFIMEAPDAMRGMRLVVVEAD